MRTAVVLVPLTPFKTMGFFDRLRRKAVEQGSDSGGALIGALRRAMDQPSPEASAEFRAAVASTTLLLAVSAPPPGIGEAPAPLEEDTAVSVLTTRDADGADLLLASTSPGEVQARMGSAAFIGLAAEEVLRLVADGDYAGIVINPGGSWIELRRNQIERLLPR